MSKFKQLAGETAIYGISSIVGRFLNFLLTPFYTKVVFNDLLPQYGIITELYSYVVFFLIFLTFGLETGYFRFVQDKDFEKKVFPTISSTLFFSSLIFIGLVFIFINPISSALQYSNHKEFIQILAIIVAIDAFSAIPFAKLRQLSKSKRFAILKIVNISVNIGCNILFFLIIPKFYYIKWIKDIFDIEYIVIYVLISNLIASIVTLILLIPEIISEKFSFDFKLIKTILPYSIPIVLAGLAGQTNEIIDRPLLKYLLTIPDSITNQVDINNYVMSQMGIYGANFKLAVIITLFIQAFRYAFEPMFFKHGKGNESKQTYADIMKYFIIFCLLMFLTISLYIDVFKYFIGSNYWEGLQIVPIILMSQVLLGILFNLSLWYKLTDKTIYGLLITGIGAVITVLSNFILIPIYGYVGAAWSHVICYSTIVTVSYFLGRKFYKVPYNLKSIFIYISLAILLYFVSTLLHFEYLVLQIAVNTVLLFVFLAIIFKKENIIRLLKRKYN